MTLTSMCWFAAPTWIGKQRKQRQGVDCQSVDGYGRMNCIDWWSGYSRNKRYVVRRLHYGLVNNVSISIFQTSSLLSSIRESNTTDLSGAFGGEKALARVRERDERKRRLCGEHGVTVVDVRFDEPLTLPSLRSTSPTLARLVAYAASAVSMNVGGGARPPLGVWFVF